MYPWESDELGQETTPEFARQNALYEIHVTGAGGFLQQAIFGWTGLRLRTNGFAEEFQPMLPRNAKKLILQNIGVGGKRYDIVVEKNNLTFIAR